MVQVKGEEIAHEWPNTKYAYSRGLRVLGIIRAKANDVAVDSLIFIILYGVLAISELQY